MNAFLKRVPRPVRWVVPAIFGGFVVYATIVWGYPVQWTGLGTHTKKSADEIPSKKLWDWLQLVIVPAVLAGGVWRLNCAQKERDQEIENERQRQKALESFFDSMSDLLLTHNLTDPTKLEARRIARSRALGIMRILDGGRKGEALQFLYECGLIYENPIVDLIGADLRDAKLAGATLKKSELRGIDFENACLKGADLCDAVLVGSVFHGADITYARLRGADLDAAVFPHANLSGADLRDVRHRNTVNWDHADLTGVKWSPE
ncbi:MAG: pentapeptide repeat-containing protein [Thermodesulfobacteriota bacterium]